MNKLFLIGLIAGLIICFHSIKAQSIELIDFKEFFTNYEGTFVLYDTTEDTYVIYNKTQAEKRLSPCSTFKIFNSLVGLETGVIKDENYIIKWDKRKYEFERWNRDHTLKSAIENSVVWYYQELAGRVGKKKMEEYIDKVNYGNKDISGGIDKFWLRSSLKISAIEQIEFLKKLLLYDLPFSKRNIEIVKNIIILDKTDKYILRGKTGSGREKGKDILGWFVGFIKVNNKTYIFATNIEAPDGAWGIEAKKITFEILKKLKII
jgi:bla regulator protein BlaR1